MFLPGIYSHKLVVLCLSILPYFLGIDVNIMSHPTEQVLSSLICKITTAFYIQNELPQLEIFSSTCRLQYWVEQGL